MNVIPENKYKSIFVEVDRYEGSDPNRSSYTYFWYPLVGWKESEDAERLVPVIYFGYYATTAHDYEEDMNSVPNMKIYYRVHANDLSEESADNNNDNKKGIPA